MDCNSSSTPDGDRPLQRRANSTSAFQRYCPADVRQLVDEYPLAWVIGAGGENASLLPLIGVFDAGDRLAELIGHFAMANPLREVFACDPRATILFKGPDGYISPTQAGRRNWGPTWNYAQARIQAEVHVDPELTPTALDLLVEHVERSNPEPWRKSELGSRYGTLVRQIVGFRARVASVDATFKLGQTETPEVFESILANLRDDTLARWMRRFNAAELE